MTNLTDDVYHDVIDIKTDKYILSICSKEEKPVVPVCSKCKKEFGEYDNSWNINQQAGYDSLRDGDEISVKICDSCFEKMFGELVNTPN